MIGRTYSVVRSPAFDWHKDEIVAAGLDWDAAKAREKLITAARPALTARPHATCWASDVFYCKLEGSPAPARRRS